MNSVDHFVRTSILAYPSVMKTRSEVLHHTLCVIGTNDYWSHGEVKADQDAQHEVPWSYEEHTREIEEEARRDGLRDYMVDYLMQHAAGLRNVVSNIDMQMYDMTPVKNFYPQTSFALLMNIPEDVTPEWREACDQMWELAISNGWEKP
jgi:hypothetical protein